MQYMYPKDAVCNECHRVHTCAMCGKPIECSHGEDQIPYHVGADVLYVDRYKTIIALGCFGSKHDMVSFVPKTPKTKDLFRKFYSRKATEGEAMLCDNCLDILSQEPSIFVGDEEANWDAWEQGFLTL